MRKGAAFIGLLCTGVLLEVAGDVLLKQWSLTGRRALFATGLALYGAGSVFWVYSLKYEALSKVGTVFMLLNIMLIAVAGVLIFKEHLSVVNKIGIALGIVSIFLVEA